MSSNIVYVIDISGEDYANLIIEDEYGIDYILELYLISKFDSNLDFDNVIEYIQNEQDRDDIQINVYSYIFTTKEDLESAINMKDMIDIDYDRSKHKNTHFIIHDDRIHSKEIIMNKKNEIYKSNIYKKVYNKL